MQPANILANFPGIAAARIPDDLCVYFNDFFEYAAADWTVSTTEAGSGTATEAVTDGVGGLLLLHNAAGADDSTELEAVPEAFKLAAGKPLWFEARVKIDDTGLGEWFIGLLINTGAAKFSSGDTVTDSAVYFVGGPTDVAADYIEGRCEKDTVETNGCTAHKLVVNDTFHKVQFFFDGIDTVYFYVDGEFLGNVTESDFSSSVQIPDDEELAVAFGINNSSAVRRDMYIDYIMVAQVR